MTNAQNENILLHAGRRLTENERGLIKKQYGAV